MRVQKAFLSKTKTDGWLILHIDRILNPESFESDFRIDGEFIPNPSYGWDGIFTDENGTQYKVKNSKVMGELKWISSNGQWKIYSGHDDLILTYNGRTVVGERLLFAQRKVPKYVREKAELFG